MSLQYLKEGFVLSLILFVTVFSFSCSTNPDEIKALYSKLEMPDEQGRDVLIVYSKKGIIKARLSAPLLIRHFGEDDLTEFPEGLHLIFYNEDGDIENELTSNYGLRNEKTEEMLAKDDVVVINKKGEKLNTEELIWNQKTSRIYSEKFVRIQTADEIIYGDGLDANEDFSEYTILNIKGIINLQDESI